MPSPAPRGQVPSAGGDEVVVVLGGTTPSGEPADAWEVLHRALAGGARRIVVDLRGPGSLGSPALAGVLAAHRVCRARGGGVVLLGVDRRTADMLRRTGLCQVLQVRAEPPPTKRDMSTDDRPQAPHPRPGEEVRGR